MKKYCFITFIFFFGLLSCSNGETKTQNQDTLRPSVPLQNGEVQIGTQVWTTRNLNVTRYRNGDPIPQVTDPTQWRNLTTGAWCYYNNDSANGLIYGKLYNWYAVNDPRGLAPEGWNIPTKADYEVLTSYLGGSSIAGGKMKESGTTFWIPPNSAASNSSGFSGRGGGHRGDSDASFYNIRFFAYWWTSTQVNAYSGWSLSLNSNSGAAALGPGQGFYGFSVRCVKNASVSVVPATPSNLIGTAVTSTQINLTWTDNSTNETGFKIERKIGSGNYAMVGTVSANVVTYSNTGLIPNTTYTYRVYAYNSVGTSTGYSNEVTITPTTAADLPNLTTTAVSSITSLTAVSGGIISSDGGTLVTSRGVCWSTSPNPTTALPTKTNDGVGTGVFVSTISGLTNSTTYYVRAYATNSAGTAYGIERSFITPPEPIGSVTDIDGNTYQAINICSQTWMQQNLNVSKYNDGTPIPEVWNVTDWENLTTGAWCYYENNTANGPVYGKLYNWYAVAGIYDSASLANPALRKKLAPTGWHVPSFDEWYTLINPCLGGFPVAGDKMKSTNLWLYDPDITNTNSSGFTGFPGGYRYFGTFIDKGERGSWWSSTEVADNPNYSWARWLGYYLSSANSDQSMKKYGLSVRCVKD